MDRMAGMVLVGLGSSSCRARSLSQARAREEDENQPRRRSFLLLDDADAGAASRAPSSGIGQSSTDLDTTTRGASMIELPLIPLLPRCRNHRIHPSIHPSESSVVLRCITSTTGGCVRC